jgi:hypothetical protein
MATEHFRSTSAASSSRHTASFNAEPASQAASSISAGPSTNASPNHAQNQWQFIESLALAIAKEMKRIPLLGTMGAPVFGGTDVTSMIEEYESRSTCTGTHLATQENIATCPYNWLETIQEMMKMLACYLGKDCEQLKWEI